MATSGMAQAKTQMEKSADYSGQFFLGTVVSNQDPEFTERLRIRIPNLYGPEFTDDKLPWARPVKHRVRGPKAGSTSIAVPDVGSHVVVILQEGNPYAPLYLGGLLMADDVPPDLKVNYPSRYGLRDGLGNQFYVDTSTGDLDFKHVSGLTVHVKPSGELEITSPSNLKATFQGNVEATVQGNVTATVNGNVQASVNGSMSVDANSGISLTSSSAITISAPTVSIN